MKVGQIVKYANPESGEESDRFEVVEVHLDAWIPRVHVRLITNALLRPYSVMSPENLIVSEESIKDPTHEQICSVLGCTVKQSKALFRRNADALRSMLAKAESSGRAVNGYTADALRKMVSVAEQRAK